MNVIVVGSGPSGISCAAGLLASGHFVTLIDSGTQMFEGEEDIRTRMLKMDPDSLFELTLRNESKSTLFSQGHPTKSVLGARVKEAKLPNPIDSKLFGMKISNVIGGLTNVWGATLLPLNLTPLWKNIVFQESIESLLKTLNIPKTCQIPSEPFDGSIQRMPLAVHINGSRKCSQMGVCIAGCPNDSIYSAAHSLAELSGNNKFRLIQGCKIERVAVTQDNKIIAEGLNNPSSDCSFVADKIFLACGPISTFEILARSNIIENTSILRDSAMTIIPTIYFKRAKTSMAPGGNLTQNFVSIATKYSHPLFLQLYDPSLIFASKIRFTARRIDADEYFPRFIFKFLGVTTAYADSRDSKSIVMKYSIIGDKKEQLHFESIGRSIRVKIGFRNFFNFIKLGVVPLTFLGKSTAPGTGIHYGGTMPMSIDFKKQTTNQNGSLWKYPNISIVDSSILPEIPAGPITLTLISNAYRIGLNT